MRFIVVYRAKDGWRWHALASGRIVEESGEAYTRRRDCMRAIGSKLKATYTFKV